MNILYIGPYRNELAVGHASRNIINTLSEISNLTIRPIYISNNNFPMSLKLDTLEQKDTNNDYDIIIQHCSPYLLSSLYDKNIKAKNIAIPIINKTINKKQYEILLSDFDKILADDATVELILRSNYSLNNVELFRYNIIDDKNKIQKINLDIHNQNKKFYFIGSFFSNKQIIKTIIKSFYFTFGNSTDMSLILFILENTEESKAELNKIIENVKKELNIVGTNYCHKIIVKILSENDLLSAHNSCDIFISLCDSGIESSFNKTIASTYGNYIIDESNTNMFYDTDPGYLDTYYFGEVRLTTNIISLSQSMVNSLNSTTKANTNTAQTIDKIICQ